MHPIIKWPGGKTREINNFHHLIPEHRRYIEPFFGGGALFFHLRPKNAAINDISETLISYYKLIKDQDKILYNLLVDYDNGFNNLINVCSAEADFLSNIFFELKDKRISEKELENILQALIDDLSSPIQAGFEEDLILNKTAFEHTLYQTTRDKFLRTLSNYNKAPYSQEDLKENLITGFANGFYIYFRNIFNDINLGKTTNQSPQYKAANFYFIREYCYGSMFRYNSKGEFNVPYGGMSYNRKNMRAKIENMFNKEIQTLFLNTEIHCSDFATFFDNIHLTSNDFIFLDPLYDTDFSDYEGNDFTKFDQERLAHSLKHSVAKFILVIKSTNFIKSLYEKEFNIKRFEKQYTCNVRGRNDRNVEHLIITNFPV